MIEEMREKLDGMELVEYYEYVCEKTGYVAMLQEKNDMESRGRLENVEELTSSIHAFLDHDPDNPTLSGFLDEVALYTDLDDTSDKENCVVMMTMHSAKGLEFPYVYVVGMEEGVFPGNRVLAEDDELEEERRICYVGITRAQDLLTMTFARSRMVNGETNWSKASRFVDEIPDEYLEKQDKVEQAKELLKNPELSIKEICIMSGYSDPNYFSRIFKKWTDETPSEYRERILSRKG